MQIVSNGDSLHKISEILFSWKNKKSIIYQNTEYLDFIKK